MGAQAMVLEFGMGVDVHGEEGTKAACRAVSDAIRHSSLPLFTEVRAKGGRMLVDVTVGVPDPGKVDVERVKKELPHGEVTVRPVLGGLRVPNADTIIATRSKGEWIDALEAEGVPCAIINALPDAITHPQAQALGIAQPMPGDEDLRLIALPLSFDGVRPGIRRAPPAKIGEHDHEVRAARGRWPAS